MPENPHYIERLTDKRLDINVLHAFLRTLALQDERLEKYISTTIQLVDKRISEMPKIAVDFPVYVCVWNHKDQVPELFNDWGGRINYYPHLTVFSYFNSSYIEFNKDRPAAGSMNRQYTRLWLVSDEVEELPSLTAAVRPTRDAWVAVLKSNIIGVFQWSV